MSFISMDFAFFVLLVLVLYYIVPRKMQWVILLIAGYVFYGYNSFGDLIYILITTVSAFICAALIEKKGDDLNGYIKDNKETLSKEEKRNTRLRSNEVRSLFLQRVFFLTSVFLHI